jgi:hypothetical protein
MASTAAVAGSISSASSEAEIDNIERIGERFLCWLIRHTALVPAAFRGQPVVQLEFVNGASPASFDKPEPE